MTADANILQTAIENFIDLRDRRWNALADQPVAAFCHLPSALDDLRLLVQANKHLIAMLRLESGPRTPALPAARCRRELLRCGVCATFCARLRAELNGIPGTPQNVALEPPIPLPVMSTEVETSLQESAAA